MSDTPEELPPEGDLFRSGVGSSVGIEVIGVPYEDLPEAEGILRLVKERIDDNSIPPESGEAVTNFIDLYMQANEDRSDSGGDPQENRPTELISEEVNQGGRIVYFIIDEEGNSHKLPDGMERFVEPSRRRQEYIGLHAIDIEVPRGIEPIMFPVENEYDDQSWVNLMFEVETAVIDEYISMQEAQNILDAILCREFLKKEVNTNYIFEGNDGKYYRVHIFPDNESDDEGMNDD